MNIVEALRKAKEDGRAFVSLNVGDSVFYAGCGTFTLNLTELLAEEWEPAGPRMSGNRLLNFKPEATDNK